MIVRTELLLAIFTMMIALEIFCFVKPVTQIGINLGIRNSISKTGKVFSITQNPNRERNQIHKIHYELLMCKSDDSSAKNKVQKLVEDVLSLSLLEVNELMTKIKDRLGLPDSFSDDSNRGAAPATVVAAAPAEPVVEKTEFEIKLISYDPSIKIKIIKEVRTITGLGLKECKDMTEAAPSILKKGLSKVDAEKFKKMIVDAGGKAEII